MSVRKRSVSLEGDVAKAVERAAAEDGVSVSAWLSQAAAQRLRIREGLHGVAEWEAGAGALSPAELAAGQALLDRILAGPERAPRTKSHQARIVRRSSTRRSA